MLPTTILVDDAPVCIVRPVDRKALQRFIRTGRAFLLAERPDGLIVYRAATEAELGQWRRAQALHLAWGGGDEEFFGIPL